MTPLHDIRKLLQNFVNSIPSVRGAILVSTDGLPLASNFASSFDEDKTAAITVSVISLVGKFEQDLTTGVIEKIIIEGKEGYCVLVGCEKDLILSVLASRDIVKGWLFFEIRNLVGNIDIMITNSPVRINGN